MSFQSGFVRSWLGHFICEEAEEELLGFRGACDLFDFLPRYVLHSKPPQKGGFARAYIGEYCRDFQGVC